MPFESLRGPDSAPAKTPLQISLSKVKNLFPHRHPILFLPCRPAGSRGFAGSCQRRPNDYNELNPTVSKAERYLQFHKFAPRFSLDSEKRFVYCIQNFRSGIFLLTSHNPYIKTPRDGVGRFRPAMHSRPAGDRLRRRKITLSGQMTSRRCPFSKHLALSA